jgi:uncharacterized protein YuzE
MAEEKTMKFDYDEKADVLYVSLGTGEPSFSQELDDHIVIDIGMYTNAPTGFQILHVKEADVHGVSIQLKKTLAQITLFNEDEVRALRSARKHLMENAIKCFPKRVGELVPA